MQVSFIFTTALPPTIISGVRTSIKHLKECQAERDGQKIKVALLKKLLKEHQIPHMESESHIIPVIIGDAEKCRVASQILIDQFNIYVQPINYPTVPKGTERLRLAPTPLHTEQMIHDLVFALKSVLQELSLPIAA